MTRGFVQNAPRSMTSPLKLGSKQAASSRMVAQSCLYLSMSTSTVRGGEYSRTPMLRLAMSPQVALISVRNCSSSSMDTWHWSSFRRLVIGSRRYAGSWVISMHKSIGVYSSDSTRLTVQLSIRCHGAVMRRGILKLIGMRMTLPDRQEHTQTPSPLS